MSNRPATVHLGFEVPAGKPIAVPLAHTFVAGQTQNSGKTTVLEALVHRSGRRGVGFVTKRGERSLKGHEIRPFLPRETGKQMPWRLVESLIASTVGERKMKFERRWIVNATKGATSLRAVRENAERLGAKSKGDPGGIYEMLCEYIDLLLPEMEELNPSSTLEIEPGLNVMELADCSETLQGLVIRATLERIYREEEDVLTILPEAWEFVPRSRMTPAKDAAIALARKGAVLHNYLLSDSQDIAGVDPVIRQQSSLWLFGVQREINELERAIKTIPAGIARPRPEEIATLGLGQFIACWGKSTHRIQVQPAWMDDATCLAIATGNLDVHDVIAPAKPRRGTRALFAVSPSPQDTGEMPAPEPSSNQPKPIPPPSPADEQTPTEELEMSEEAKQKLDEIYDFIKRGTKAQAAVDKESGRTTGGSAAPADFDKDALFEEFKARLLKDRKTLLKVLGSVPEIQIVESTVTVEADKEKLRGMIALLMVEDFFDAPVSENAVWKEAKRRWGYAGIQVRVNEQMKDFFHPKGFVTLEEGGYRIVPDMKKNIKRGGK